MSLSIDFLRLDAAAPLVFTQGKPLMKGLFLIAIAMGLLMGCASKEEEQDLHVRDAPSREAMETHARRIAGLVSLTKPWEAAPDARVFRYVAALAEARQTGMVTDETAAMAVAMTAMGEGLRTLTVEAMLRNLKAAEELGCLDAEGLAEMHGGKPPAVRIGSYAGDLLIVGPIIPLATCPQLQGVIANLELAPRKALEGRTDRIGRRELDLARRLLEAGVLTSRDLLMLEEASAGR